MAECGFFKGSFAVSKPCEIEPKNAYSFLGKGPTNVLHSTDVFRAGKAMCKKSKMFRMLIYGEVDSRR